MLRQHFWEHHSQYKNNSLYVMCHFSNNSCYTAYFTMGKEIIDSFLTQFFWLGFFLFSYMLHFTAPAPNIWKMIPRTEQPKCFSNLSWAWIHEFNSQAFNNFSVISYPPVLVSSPGCHWLHWWWGNMLVVLLIYQSEWETMEHTLWQLRCCRI